ncbi:MAG: hypothetical protein WCF97_07950, partial [Nitrososphaeraceae archaeon]
IIEAFDWRATFLSVVPLSIMIIIIISKLIHEEKSIHVEAPAVTKTDGISKSYSALDLKGALALTSAITSFLLAITFLESIKQLFHRRRRLQYFNSVCSKTIQWNINWNHNSFVSRRNVNWASNFRNVHGAISVQC